MFCYFVGRDFLVEDLCAVSGGKQLSVLEKRVLDFEQNFLQFSADKEAAIVVEFGFSATRYYQILNLLLNSVAALEYNAILVERLIHLRSRGRSMRLVAGFSVEIVDSLRQ